MHANGSSKSKETRTANGDANVASAKEARLRYVSDLGPGIRRKRRRRGFEYISAKGRVIRARAQIARIDKLAIPPAWTDVWICPLTKGHLQATGRDARGRKQYRYHDTWRTTRDEAKYDRSTAFAALLPRIRRRTASDIAKRGLPREKVLATVVQLLDKSLIRVGNDEYAKQNHSFGLTTMRNDHVRVRGSKLKFEFKGKSGVRHSVDVESSRLARIVKACQDLPGQELFEYVDEDGERHDVGSADVNAYVREITGEEFTAKDFRTWAGTVLAWTALRELEHGAPPSRAKKNVVQAVERVADVLGNTKAVCRKSYIHPAIIESYLDASMFRKRGARVSRRELTGLRRDEAAVLALLRQRLPNARRKR